MTSERADIVQLVPFLPPSISGVGDFAAILGERLQASGLRSHYIVPEAELRHPLPSEQGRHRIGHCAAHLDALLQSLPQTVPLLLHYSGYGYQSQGFPLWMLNPLTAWVARGGTLLTYFHELSASGPPWRKSFYMGPLQRWLYQKLFAISRASITNTPITYQKLTTLGGGPILLQPICSNVGEPEFVPLVARTKDVAIVFGLRAQRAAVYAQLPPVLPALRRLGIKRLIDIGPHDPVPAGFDLLPVERIGPLPPTEVSAALLSHTFSLIDYQALYLGKSGIFAASSSHGMVPLLLRPGPLPEALSAGITPGKSYLDLSALPSDVSLQDIAHAGYLWYQQHCVAAQTAAIATLIRNSSPGAP